MSLVKIALAPGINKETTTYGSEGGWADSDKIRFKSGLPQNIGGWSKFTETAVVGVVRKLHTWRLLSGHVYVAIATSAKVYVESGGTIVDITPLRLEVTELGAATGPFTTVDTSTAVSVAHTAHGATVGSYVTFSGSAAVGGVPADEINTEHAITSITDDDNYVITVTTAATSSTTGGGAVVAADYQLNIGTDNSVFAFGFGTGPFGMEDWGDARSTSTVTLSARAWTLANWGEDLILCPAGGSLYVWDASTPTVRAVIITQAPYKNSYMFVTENRHIVCCGCNAAGSANSATDLDTMRIRWCSQEDKTDWAPVVTNTAGDKFLTSGTEILAGAEVEGQSLIWTDTSVYAMQPIGPPWTFGFYKAGSGCGISSPHAWMAYDSMVFWMGLGSFYSYGSGVSAMASSVQQFVFEGLTVLQQSKVFGFVNHEFNEITWFYPTSVVEDTKLNGALDATATTISVSNTAGFPETGTLNIEDESVDYTSRNDVQFLGCTRGQRGSDAVTHSDHATVGEQDNVESTEPSRYVSYSVVEGTWWVGRLERTAWADRGSLRYPIASTYNGYIMNQEFGNDADGNAMVSYIESSEFDLGEGDTFMFAYRMIPDFTIDSGSVDLTIYSRRYPHGEKTTNLLGEVSASTEKLDIRVRGRQAALRVESDSLGDKWKFGAPRLDLRSDGRQ